MLDVKPFMFPATTLNTSVSGNELAFWVTSSLSFHLPGALPSIDHMQTEAKMSIGELIPGYSVNHLPGSG